MAREPEGLPATAHSVTTPDRSLLRLRRPHLARREYRVVSRRRGERSAEIEGNSAKDRVVWGRKPG